MQGLRGDDGGKHREIWYIIVHEEKGICLFYDRYPDLEGGHSVPDFQRCSLSGKQQFGKTSNHWVEQTFHDGRNAWMPKSDFLISQYIAGFDFVCSNAP